MFSPLPRRLKREDEARPAVRKVDAQKGPVPLPKLPTGASYQPETLIYTTSRVPATTRFLPSLSHRTPPGAPNLFPGPS